MSFPVSAHAGTESIQPAFQGTILKTSFYSQALDVTKKVQVYLPADYSASNDRYPVVYFLRGMESEWFNPNQDSSRGGKSLKNVLDDMMKRGSIGKMIIVTPSTSSNDGAVYAPGVNMLSPQLAKDHEGIGKGRFEDYLTRDLTLWVDTNFRTLPDRRFRGIDGFSLGGYTSMLLGIKHPEVYSSVGAYDGTHMWKDLIDTRSPQPTQGSDLTWMSPAFFDATFGKPRVIPYMLENNASNLVSEICASPWGRAVLSRVRFHIHTAGSDGASGNLDRGKHLVEELWKCGITNSFSDVRLSANALHNWKDADRHARQALIEHWNTFVSLSRYPITIK